MYSLSSAGNSLLDEDLFAIDRQTGELKLTRPATHPISQSTARYHLIVKAEDAGNPPLSSEVSLFITVGSETNQRPSFLNRPYIATVSEEALQGDFVVS